MPSVINPSPTMCTLLTPPQRGRALPPRSVWIVAQAARQVVRTGKAMVRELRVRRGADRETESEE